MTSPAESRLAAATMIASAYGADAAVVGILCGGSTGRGHADRWSDLELGVFWSRPPTEAARRGAVAVLGGSSLRLFNSGDDEGGANDGGATGGGDAGGGNDRQAGRYWFDEWWFGGPAGAGLLVEVVHMTVADADTLLDGLLAADDVRPDTLAFAAALAQGRPLSTGRSSATVERFVDRVRVYPRSVAAAVVRRHGQVDHFWRWRMYVERHDVHGLRAHFAGVVGALVHIACALNGRWWPGAKWPQWTLANLSVAPEGFADRLAEVDHMPPAAAATALSELVEEAYDLVVQHLPEADPDRLRAIFRFARQPWPTA